MVSVNAIESAYTTAKGKGFVVAFNSTGNKEKKSDLITLIKQDGNEKVFMTLNTVRTFMNDIGIHSFTVAG